MRQGDDSVTATSERKRKKGKATAIVFTIIVAGLTPLLIYMGVTLETEENVGPTLETSAVVADTKVSGYPYYTDYYVDLDFSTSRMDAELVDLLTQQSQCIKLGSSEEFGRFYRGKEVIIVYYVVDVGGGRIKVAIESVDGYRPRQGLDDLTTPGYQKSQDIAKMELGGIALAICAVILFFMVRQRQKAKPKLLQVIKKGKCSSRRNV